VRSEFHETMFGSRLVRAFEQVKDRFDPDGLFNPGKIVRAPKFDDRGNFRYPPDYAAQQMTTRLDWSAYPGGGGGFQGAVEMCNNNGACRAAAGGVMCPSYRVTREERHTTRGRARILMEMMRGDVIKDGWRSKDVHDALDLCLACKGCRGDCPVHVDMATYKAEFLAHHYRHRLRPPSHYSMGWLPLWARIASIGPSALNAVVHTPPIARVLKRAGGIDPQRELPFFARQRFTDWFRARRAPEGAGETVLIWPDTFTDNFHPDAGRAAVRVLEAAGFKVVVPPRVCCGLTWISTGQLGVAKRVLRRTVKKLAPLLRAGTPVVGLEPSCTAVLRADAPELLPGDDDVRRLGEQTRSLAEFLLERGAPAAITAPPPGTGRTAIAQPHCHQHAIWGFDADREVLRRAGVEVDVLDAGCCGLAGNFGFERGHYDVSVACAELGLWPAVRDADPETAILADGFSCRTQIAAGTRARPMHLAELLAEPGG
jgi:Fe-S oxidoreductase